MKPVVVYTDGACRGNPGPGGWGVLIGYGEHEKELWGGEPGTTNNRMELMAAIQGLASLREACDVRVYTDSTYVLKGITKWLPNWKVRNWKTAARKSVKNADLWKRLDEETQRHQIEWLWVKGHSGESGNERADMLANRGIDELSAG